MIEILKPGETFEDVFYLADPSTGAAIDADATPTAIAFYGNAETGETVSVSNIATETGAYAISFTPLNQADGDKYTIAVTATVGGNSYPSSKFKFRYRAAGPTVAEFEARTLIASDYEAAATAAIEETGLVAIDRNADDYKRRYLKFEAGDSINLGSASLSGSVGTVLALVKMDSATGAQTIGQYSGSSAAQMQYPDASGNLIMSWLRTASVTGLTPAPEIDRTEWHWLICRTNVAEGWESLQGDIDGTLYSIGTAAGNGFANFAVRILGTGNGLDFEGAIARFLVFNERMTDTQIQEIIAGGIGSRERCQIRYEAWRNRHTNFLLDHAGDQKHREATLASSESDFWVNTKGVPIASTCQVYAPLQLINKDQPMINVIDGREGINRGEPSIMLFDDGTSGILFDTNERLVFPIKQHTKNDLRCGYMSCDVKTNRRFADGVATSTYHLVALHAQNDILDIVSANEIGLKLRYEGGTTGIVIYHRGTTEVYRALNSYVLEEGEEINLGLSWETHAEDDSQVNVKLWLNGYCILDNGLQSFTDWPQTARYVTVGNANTAGDRPAQCSIKNVCVMTSWKPNGRDIKNIAKGTYDFDALPPASEISKPAVTQTLIDAFVMHFDRQGYLWGASASDQTKLVRTSDLSGQGGWTEIATFAGNIRDVATNDNFVFVSYPGSVQRSAKTSVGTFTEIQETVVSATNAASVPGWGLDAHGTKVVIAEYITPFPADGCRLMVSDDNGDTFTTLLTHDNTGGVANSHWHAAAYDPYTGWLWANWGDETEGILWSADNGTTINYLQIDSYNQPLGWAFNDKVVVTGVDRSVADNAAGLIAFSKSGKDLHNYEGTLKAAVNPIPSGSNRSWRKDMYYAARGQGGLLYSSGWGVGASEDGRFAVYRNSEGQGGSSYLEIISADLELQTTLQVFDDNDFDFTAVSAVTFVDDTIFVGRQAFALSREARTGAKSDTMETRVTEARLAKLDVTGTLANADNADSFKAEFDSSVLTGVKRNVSFWDWGNRDNHLSLPVLPNFQVPDAWSISAWVRCNGKIDVGSPTPRGMILEHSHDGVTRVSLRLDTNDNGKFVGVVYQVSGGFTSVWSHNNRQWDDGKWHHVVLTNDNRTLKLYVDGYDVGVAAAASAQALAAGGKIGLETTNARKSIHHQTDTIVLNRVLTQQEVLEITLQGPDSDLSNLAESFTARWSPRYVNATTEADRSGNGYGATWSSFDHAVYCLEDYPNKEILESIHAVGNSLTVDAAIVQAGNLATWSINSGQDMQYAAANPTTAESNCIPWGTALSDRRYRVLSLQPYPNSQTIADEVAAMQTIIDEFPAPGIILVHEGFAPSATVITGTEIEEADDGDVKHSIACMEEIVRQIQEANPGHRVIRSKTNEAVHLAYSDILDSNVSTGQIVSLDLGASANTSLYRDAVHANYLVGRYLIHHCCRRALGITEKVRDYPFLENPLYPSSTCRLETLEWLDTVVDRVWPTTATKLDAIEQTAVDSITQSELQSSMVAALEEFNNVEDDPYVFGDQSILRGLVHNAFDRCQRVAVLGDSQEAAPGGVGRVFIHRLATNAFYVVGPPSETHLCFPLSNANNAWTRTSSVEFQGTTYSITQLPESSVRDQNGSTYGFLSLLNPRADATGGMTQASHLVDRELWMDFETLVADYYLFGNPAGPDQIRIKNIPNTDAAASYFDTLIQTITEDLSLSGVSGWVEYTTPPLTAGDPYPQLILQGWNGSAVTNGLICGGMRFRDASRDSGLMFQSFGDGGNDVGEWFSTYDGSYAQFNAYGDWSAIMLCFGANDSASIDAASFKILTQNAINTLRGSNWQQGEVPIILVSDSDRTVGGSYTAPMQLELAAYPAKLRELAEENEGVVFIDMFKLLNDRGFDPATGTSDGVHLTDEWALKRADLLWNQIVKFAGKTGFATRDQYQSLAARLSSLQSTATEGRLSKLDVVGGIALDGPAGTGNRLYVHTVLDGGAPTPGVTVFATTDVLGVNKVAGNLISNSSGVVAFRLNAGQTYYLWETPATSVGANPIQITVPA